MSISQIPSIIAYCSASICMTLTNKMVLSGFKFKLPFLILAVQSLSSVLLLEIFTLTGLTSHRAFSREDAKNWLPVSSLMAVMLYTGSKALQHLSVPIFTIFKNITIILVAYGESKIFGGHVTSMMLFSFVLMVVSSIMAAWDDLSSIGSGSSSLANLRSSALAAASMTAKTGSSSSVASGYFWISTNCISSAAFVLFMRYTLKKPSNSTRPQFKDFDTVFYNNLLTFPMFLFFSLAGADGRSSEFWTYYGKAENLGERNTFFFSVFFSGVSAFWISYASSWCMRVTNSTTYSMVGALNKLPIAVSGLIFFNDTPITVSSVGSIVVGFISGIIYTVAKIRNDESKRKELPLSKSSENVYIGLKETSSSSSSHKS